VSPSGRLPSSIIIIIIIYDTVHFKECYSPWSLWWSDATALRDFMMVMTGEC